MISDMPNEKLEQVALRIKPSVHKAVNKLAAKKKMGVGELLRAAVTEYLERPNDNGKPVKS